MNHLTNYERIAVIVPASMKADLIKYKEKSGRDLTWTMRRLIEKLLSGEIDLDTRHKINSYKRSAK